MPVMRSHFILYVRDQDASTAFYAHVLGAGPTLNVPGMTEFALGRDAVLGLMPEAGVTRLLGPAVNPSTSPGASRAELYLLVDDPGGYHARALSAGAEELSALAPRSWGHEVAYSRDRDGAILAFAREPS
jgi:catechol 2,3-dioxygenase-like lactoylglutathione lyase family enzyme